MSDESQNQDPRVCRLDNKTDNQKEKAEDLCPWWVNSPEHGNCLWLYIKDKSGPDGSMSELVQSEIAALLGCSNTKTHFMLKQAMVELIDALHQADARQLLTEDSDTALDIPHSDPTTHSEDSDD